MHRTSRPRLAAVLLLPLTACQTPPPVADAPPPAPAAVPDRSGLLAALPEVPPDTLDPNAPLPAHPPPRSADPDWRTLRKVVYYDSRYPSAWVTAPAEVAAAISERGEYAVLDAYMLRNWMDAHIAAGAAGSVCILAQGVAPDTVAERAAADCTVRRYMNAGGRVVWIGDVPFFYQGHTNGNQDLWQRNGEKQVLGLGESAWDSARETQITDEGRTWGVTQPDDASRPVRSSDVTTVLTHDGRGNACSWFKNYSPAHPEGGFLRYRGGKFEEPRDELIADLLRVAAHGVAIAPAPDNPGATALSVVGAHSSFLFVRRGAAVRQVLRVTVDNWWRKTPASAVLHAGGLTLDTPVPSLPFGRTVIEIDAPIVAAPTPAAVEIVAAGVTTGATVTLLPRRRWTLFLDPSVHTDIGYTDYQEAVLKLHNENLDKAVAACAQMPSFKWDLENAWQLEHYEAERTPEQVAKILDYIGKRQIGVSALYLNILTGACTAESFNRSALGAAVLRRRFGIRTPQAILTDVPSAVGTLPTMLARSGIRYFAQGINQTRAPYYADPQAPPMPFWWEGPDGSRVLTWLSNTAYANAAHFEFTRGIEPALRHVTPWLEAFEKRDYPWDAALLYGGVSDNQPLDPNYARVLDEWNARYAFPRMVLAAQGEFFEYMEAKYGPRIPVLRGDNGCYWEDGAASTAKETTLNRRSQEDIVTAEKLFAFNALLGDARPYPKAEFDRQWSNILFYIEHTWGAHNSITQPDVEFVRKQWLYKANYANEPATVLGPMVKDGIEWLGRRVRTGETPAVLVFNPLSWDRLDVVRVDLPPHLRGTQWTVTRAATGEALATQRIDERTLAFTSTADTGGIGYETYPLAAVAGDRPQAAPLPGSPSPFTRGEGWIENRFYKVTLDLKTGAIASILDKDLGRELVDAAAPHGANEYLYVSGGENSRLHEASAHLPEPRLKVRRPEAAAIRAGADGPVFASLVVEAKNHLTPSLRSEIILYRDVKRIDIVNRLAKQETYEKEGVYFAFPFNFRDPDIRLEIPDGVVRPEADQFGGGCRDWYAVQHWIELSEVGATSRLRSPGASAAQAGRDPGTGAASARAPAVPLRVTLSAPDSLLFCIGDIFRGKWMKKGELQIADGTLYAWLMNNYWFTNYKAGQGGDFEFRFSITSAEGGADDVAASRFGWGACNPLLAAVLPSHQQGSLPPAQAFVTADRPNAAITAFKRSEDGASWVVRVLDLNGDGGPVRLGFPAFDFTEARLANLVEEPERALPIADRAVEVPLDKRGLATVLMK